MGIVQNPQIAQNSDDNKKTQVRYIPATTEIPLGGEIKYSLIHGEDFEKYDMPGVSELFNFLSQIPEVLSMISPYWISGTTYNVSDMKIYNNKLYICNKKHVAGNDNFPDTSQFWKNIVYEESIHSYINDIRNGIYEYVNSIIHTHDYSKDIRVSADGLRKFVEENTKRQMRIVELNINVGKKEAKTYTDKQNSNQYNKLISEIHAAETRAKNHIHTIFKDEYDILLEKQIHGDQVQKTYTDTREGIIRRDTENNLTKAIDETIAHSDNEDHKLDRKLSDTKTELTNKILENTNSIHNNYTHHTNVRNNDYNHFTSEDARIEKKLEDFFCDTGWMIKKDSTWTCPMSGYYNVFLISSHGYGGSGGGGGGGGGGADQGCSGSSGHRGHSGGNGGHGGRGGSMYYYEPTLYFSKGHRAKIDVGDSARSNYGYSGGEGGMYGNGGKGSGGNGAAGNSGNGPRGGSGGTRGTHHSDGGSGGDGGIGLDGSPTYIDGYSSNYGTKIVSEDYGSSGIGGDRGDGGGDWPGCWGGHGGHGGRGGRGGNGATSSKYGIGPNSSGYCWIRLKR